MTPRNGIATRARSRFVHHSVRYRHMQRRRHVCAHNAICDDQHRDWWGSRYRLVSTNFRPLALAIAALSSAHITAAAAQSVNVAPGGV